MELVTPAIGQLFWAAIIFLLLLFILGRYAWKPIVKAVNERADSIKESLELADKTKAEMKQLQAQNESALRDAKIERDKMLKDASDTAKTIIADSKEAAKEQHDKIVTDAQKVIQAEKAAAISELKTTVAALSLEIAEKVINGEMASDDKQRALAERLADDINLN